MLILSVFLFHHLNGSIKTLHLILPVRYVRIILHLNSWPKLAGLQCSTIISWHAFGVSQPSHSWATAIQSWQHGIPQRWPLDHPVEQHSLRRKANLPLSGELRFTGNSHDWLGFPGLFDIALALTPKEPPPTLPASPLSEGWGQTWAVEEESFNRFSCKKSFQEYGALPLIVTWINKHVIKR